MEKCLNAYHYALPGTSNNFCATEVHMSMYNYISSESEWMK